MTQFAMTFGATLLTNSYCINAFVSKGMDPTKAAGYLLGCFCPVGTVTWVWQILGGLFMDGTVGLATGRTAVILLTGEFPPEAIGTAAGGLLVPELEPKGELQQKANANK